jgi:haloalkane dehalogenase
MTKTIRTPEEQFENLPDYNFQPNYVEVTAELRMHYVDKGEIDAPVILLLHGEPSWSYLYRKMIPKLVEAGFRTIVPDLIGFGKSDKLMEQDAYSYQNHLDWLQAFIDKLGLQNMTLFCQDWGGLLGLRLVSAHPENFVRVVASNTTLPTGQFEMPKSFLEWREFSRTSEKFDIGKVIDMGTATELSEEVIAAYNAPFPSEEYKAGARIFPSLVPYLSDDQESLNNVKAWETLSKWKKPFLTVFGSEDTIMKGAEKLFKSIIPGCEGQLHGILHAGHFIQEDTGEELAEAVVAFCEFNPLQNKITSF